MKKKDVVVIGGGVIGLSCAYYLQEAGCQVTVIDQGTMEDGCSYGNAGMITPSHFVPLAAPGMIQKGMMWMFNPESPFYIKPRFDLDLFSWAWKFYRAASPQRVERAAPVLRDVSLLSKQLFKTFAAQAAFQFAFEERGILMMYKTDKAGAEEAHNAHMASQLGIEANILSLAAVKTLEPNINLDILGAVHYPGDAHLSPGLFLKALKANLRTNGTTILPRTTVKQFELKGKKIQKIITDQGDFSADEYILATGSWSPILAQQLRLKIPIQAGKGYSFTLAKPMANLNTPAILMEAKIAVTPMEAQLRFAGTMEIAGLDLSINPRRVKGIIKSIPAYLPDFAGQRYEDLKIWKGLRPCSPDGLPFVGRAQRYANLSIAAGHAMLGLTLGPATGKLIAETLLGQPTSCAIDLLDPARYD